MKMPKSPKNNDDMRPEYDFSKAERGKFYKPLSQGYSVNIEQEDGSVIVNHYALTDGTILLEPDVRAFFPDSKSVNDALRSVIQLTQKMSGAKYRPSASSPRRVAEKKIKSHRIMALLF